MKIQCECGSLIYDQTVLYPDDEAVEGSVATAAALERIRQRLGKWSRSMWQCQECGSLYVDDREHRVHRFQPATADAPRDLLASIHGEQWKRPLRGSWRPSLSRSPQMPPGELWWGGGADSGFEQFDSREELERRYYEVFQRLLDKGVLRNALLHHEGRQVHRWPTPSSDTT
jgi:hypothetical protein